ncbi:hypothetical protein TNCV_366371 [Trichonephila clavipes]|nr:hypothetical protein TNCV_366371 [Trichonephila clavipes]
MRERDDPEIVNPSRKSESHFHARGIQALNMRSQECDGLIENKSGRERKSILSDVAKRKVLKNIKIDPKLSAVNLAAETSRIMG